ncbi:ATP synthase F1 subunit delta [Mucisphaera sp.]|uniref:ATP synthase F1 subunit delta n=1 Tax=Mucisphaera sp. TaxID=2913024 RepID=UPI003D14A6FC
MAQTTDVTIDAVARVYAQSLLEMAEAAGEAAGVVEQMQSLQGLLADREGLGRLLDGHALGAPERAGVIERVLKPHVHDLVYRFIQVLNRKDRLSDLRGVIASLSQQYRASMGIEDVTVTLAVEPDDQSRQLLEQKLGEALGKQIALTTKVDPSLIGGMVTRIGDQQIDASVATRLRKMSHRMMDAGRVQARQTA